MTETPAQNVLDTLPPEAKTVRDFLDASMKPAPDLAATFMSDDVVITFTDGQKHDHPTGTTAFNAARYKWVKKKFGQFDVAKNDSETVVYSTGWLYGEWPDGTAFDGNRYVDRFVIKNGKIVKMDVWNESAERILVRKGIRA